MLLAFPIAFSLLAAMATEEVRDAFFAALAAADIVDDRATRDPNARIAKTIATAPVDTATIVNRARGETPELTALIVVLPVNPRSHSDSEPLTASRRHKAAEL